MAQWAALALTLGFLLLPLAAVFIRPGLAEIVRQLGSDVVVDALIVSVKTSVIAHVIVLLVGTPAAYLIARRRFVGRDLVVSIIELPLVLPPAVAGIGMLAAFGRRGLLGETFQTFEAIDQNVIGAARTLGARPLRVFWRVALPLAAGGLGAASTLAFARGLGEFGATIIFAGSFQGRTQTLPLAIYAEFDRDFNRALAIGAFLIVVSIVILFAAKVVPRWTRSVSTSPFRSGTSSLPPA